jgi:sarcosine oxidase gamma subunit
MRLVWVGPNDWFVMGAKGQEAEIESRHHRCEQRLFPGHAGWRAGP